MTNSIIVEKYRGRICCGLIENGRVVEIAAQSNSVAVEGSIFLGRIENVLDGMQSAFVSIGLDKNAFISRNDVPENVKFKAGQEFPVQIIKIPGGTKGLRVSGNISLAGRMCVLRPYSGGVGVSKRIENAEESERIRQIALKLCPAGMGLIMRTNSEGASEKALEEDVFQLIKTWNDLKKRSQCIKAPVLLHSEDEVISRVLRDYVSNETEAITVSGDSLYDEVQAFIKACIPEALSKLRKHESDIALFTVYAVTSQIDKALSRKVWLQSGGYLIFDYTEALTVVDVNTGKFVGNDSLRETVFNLNLEAADELAYQLRLRDIGGIIIVDFIDMAAQSEKKELLEHLKEAFKPDRTHTTVVDITPLGLVEITRKRRRERLCDIFGSGD